MTADPTAAFLSNLHGQPWVLEIFDALPDILFYVKDADCRWVTCNEASLRFLNFANRADVQGAVEYDFFPQKIADAIRADDLDILRNNRPIINRTELIVDDGGYLVWVSTNKIPLQSADGEVAGLMGTTRLLRRLDDLPDTYRPFHEVMEYIQANIAGPIEITKLAEIAHLSASQFRKRFRQLFRLSPQEFVLRTRLQKAAKLLSATDEPLVKVALSCGFCDQSYFTKQFRAFFAMTPRRYRKVWQNPLDE